MGKKLLIGAVTVVAVAAVYGGTVYYQNKMTKSVESVLAYVSPSGKATFKALEYSIFSDDVILRGVVLASSDAKAPSVTIDTVTVRKPNEDNIRTVFNAASYVGDKRNPAMLPLADMITVEGVRGQQTGPYEISLDKMVIDQLKARQFDQTPAADISFLLDRDGKALLGYAEAIQFKTIALDALRAKKTRASTDEDGFMGEIPRGTRNDASDLGVDQIVLGGLENRVLKSLMIKGISLTAEEEGFKKEKDRTQTVATKLSSFTVENADLASFWKFGELLQNGPENVPAGFRDVTLGKLAFDGYELTTKSIRPLSEWELDDSSDDEEGEEANSPTEQKPGSDKPLVREDNVNTQIKSFSLTSLEKGILGELRIEGLDFKLASTPVSRYGTHPVSYHQGLFALKNLDISNAFGLMMAGASGGDEKMMGALVEQMFSPVQAEKVEVKDIRFEEVETGVISLGELTSNSTYKDDILVAADSVLTAFSWEFPEKVSSYDPRSSLRDMGYNSVSFSGQGKETFTPENGRYQLTFDLVGKDMGSLGLNVDLGNYPRKKRGKLALDEGRRQMWKRLEVLFKQIELNSAELRYTDASLFGKIIDYAAKQDESSADDMRKQMQMMLVMGIEPGAVTLEKAAAEISKFIENPASLTFSLKPAKPIVLSSLDELEDSGPEAVFSLLNLVVTYTGKDGK